jgi:hypothetical protein
MNSYSISQNIRVNLKIIGCDFDLNSWLYQKNYSHIRIELQERKNRDDLLRVISEADLGVNLVRNPEYDLGTKVFDYIACGIPIFNYFDHTNNFTDYFKNHFHNSNLRSTVVYSRTKNILKYRGYLLK